MATAESDGDHLAGEADLLLLTPERQPRDDLHLIVGRVDAGKKQGRVLPLRAGRPN